nr:hypothetical protein K-LCC10_0398 [Kaumoebavirus]
MELENLLTLVQIGDKVYVRETNDEWDYNTMGCNFISVELSHPDTRYYHAGKLVPLHTVFPLKVPAKGSRWLDSSPSADKIYFDLWRPKRNNAPDILKCPFFQVVIGVIVVGGIFAVASLIKK